MQNTAQRQNHFWERVPVLCRGQARRDRWPQPDLRQPSSSRNRMHVEGRDGEDEDLQELKKLGQGLPQLWQTFKSDVGDPDLSKFNVAVVALDNYEDLRYPDDALKNGMESVIIDAWTTTIKIGHA
ncbi:hypothetical protein [Bradyrhizobium pachyrhizi]|uniref:hypothetical protein n=1 Tax=Bradyrhizobium pachyrhizi TaxID=280333 RepID=UPI002AA5CE7E